MKKRFFALCFAVLACGLASVPATHAFDRARFAQPPGDSRPSVLWFWNGTVTPDLIDRQLADLRAQGVDDVLVFPFDTPNLRPRFFTEEWFDVIEHTLREAQRHGMHLWLFNDDIFPSGRGGGFVVNGGRVGDRTYEPRPDLRMKNATSAGARVVAGGRRLDVRGLLVGALAVEDGRLVVDARSRAGVSLLRDGADWQDYEVTTTVRIEEGTAGTMVRSPDERNGYLVDLNARGALEVWRQVDGAFTLLRQGTPQPGFDPAADHEVGIRVTGDELVASLDGEVVATVADATFPRGRVGVRAVATQRSLRDDLRVTAADGTVLLDETFDAATALDRFDVPSPVDRLAAVAARPASGPGAEDPAAIVDLTEHARSGRAWDAPAGDWRVETYVVQLLVQDEGFRRQYLDTLDDEAVGRFLDVVAGEYHRRFPWAFGTVLRGFADDEPYVASADAHFNTTPWSPSLERALRRAGTTPAQALTALADSASFGREGKRIRGRFWRAVSDRFGAAYYKQQHRWMERHGVDFISNPLWDEYGPAEQVRSTGNLNVLHQWSQIPGTDVIYDQFERGLHRMLPRWGASAAHQLGLPLVYNESMGAFGWHVTPGDTRDVNGAFAARGVNFTLLHAAFSDQTNVGYPPPFDAANPWWRLARPLNEWLGRVMEFGRSEAVAPTALLQPQRAAEAAQGTADADELDGAFTIAAHALEDEQVDFDLLDEGALSGDPLLRAHAVVRGGALVVGRMRYEAVVLPPTPQLSLEAALKLERFVRAGGTLIAAGPLPAEEVDGRDAELRAVLARVARRATQLGHPGAAGRAAADAGLAAATLTPSTPEVRVLRLREESRRRGADTLGFLVVNERDTAVELTARFRASGAPTLWDPDTGEVAGATTYRDERDGVAVPLRLDPHEVVGVTFDGRRGAREALHAVAVSDGATVEALERGRDWGHGHGGWSGHGHGREPRAVVRVTRPGRVTVDARHGERALRGSVTSSDPLTPVALGGNWHVAIEAPGGPTADRPLGSWTDLAAAHSGSARYERSFELTAGQLGGRLWSLDLGDVRDAAEVAINGRSLDGPLLWAPYRADVTRLLRPGRNTIAVRVTNTGANRHGDVRPSGLLGPVRLVPERRVTVPLGPVRGERTLRIEPAVADVRVAPGQQRAVRVTVRDPSGRSGRVRLDASVSGAVQIRSRRVDVQLGRDGVGSAELILSAAGDAVTPATGELRLRAEGAAAVVPVRVDLATRLGRAWASSTTAPWSAARLIDGVTRVDAAAWRRGEAWNDGSRFVFPDSVTVAFDAPAPVSSVRIWTLDTEQDPAADWGVRDVDVQLEVDGAWRTVAEVRGNRQALAEVEFPRTVAGGLRLVIRDAPEDYSRLVEVEALP